MILFRVMIASSLMAIPLTIFLYVFQLAMATEIALSMVSVGLLTAISLSLTRRLAHRIAIAISSGIVAGLLVGWLMFRRATLGDGSPPTGYLTLLWLSVALSLSFIVFACLAAIAHPVRGGLR